MLNGDLNTSFFHANFKMNKHRNSIFQIFDQQRIVQSSREGIEQACLDHYSTLWFENSSFSFSQLENDLPPNLPPISTQDSAQLIRKVSNEEIFSTVNSLALGKSSRLDGFNVEFYWFFCIDIQEKLLNAVKYFFFKLLQCLTLGVLLILLLLLKKTTLTAFLIFVQSPCVMCAIR